MRPGRLREKEFPPGNMPDLIRPLRRPSKALLENLPGKDTMTTSIAILGSGGKMGFRITRKLMDAGYDVRAVDIGEAGRQRLAEADIRAVDVDEGVKGARVVVLALPDDVIGKVA